MNDFDAHLAATRAHIDSLRDQITRAGLHVDAALSERLAQVEVERDTAEQRLSRLKQATQEQWSNLQGGLGTMLDSLDTRVDTLRTQLHRAATKH